MSTITERVLASTGLASNLAAMQPREMGLTSDTERPAVGTTGGGSKYIGTEDFITVNVITPVTLPMLKRSIVRIYAAAAGHSQIDIRNGAEVAGYICTVTPDRTAQKYAIVTYSTGLVQYVPPGKSCSFIWTGTNWCPMDVDYGFMVGEYRDMPVYIALGTPDQPVVPVWDSDHVLSVTNYPLLVPVLRGILAPAWDGAAYQTSFTATIAGAGPFTATGAGTAWTNLLTAWAEEALVNGGYSGVTPITVANVEYAVTNINAGTGIVTATGSPPLGAQTVNVYRHRIVGSSTTAKTFKDSGRALMSPDGITLVPGFRRRNRMQGHIHPVFVYNGSSAVGQVGVQGVNQNVNLQVSGTAPIQGPSTDGPNGTPRTGPDTEPNSVTVYRCIHAGVIL